MHRSNLSGQAADFLTLAEAQLNRRLNMIEMDQSLTGTQSNRRIDITSYNVSKVIGVWNTYYDGDDVNIPIRPDGSFAYSDQDGVPRKVATDGANDYLDFDCPLLEAYTFRMRYRGRFALANDEDTNQLLTDHPDVYLLACMVWGNIYTRNDKRLATLAGALEKFVNEAQHYNSLRFRSDRIVDPGLMAVGGGRGYNINSDQ
jgi:hypothetical protein